MDPTGKTIGILGGTGPLGSGLALRWGLAGERVIIGSRRPEAAQEAAEELARISRNASQAAVEITGAGNGDCAQSADILVISVPWAAHNDTVKSIAAHTAGKTVLNVVSPLEKGKSGVRAIRVEGGSASQVAQELLPEAQVVGGFHHVSAVKLRDVDLKSLEMDVMLVGDDAEAVGDIATLVEKIPGMRGVYAGKLESAAPVEGLTANLIATNRRYKTNAGVKITGISSSV